MIAHQARTRTDQRKLTTSDELIAELGLLVAHRRDLMADRTRSITRLRDALMAVFPGLERARDLDT